MEHALSIRGVCADADTNTGAGAASATDAGAYEACAARGTAMSCHATLCATPCPPISQSVYPRHALPFRT
eukprot:8289703-Lingulodinium_polyedra.AAC.1